MLADRVEEKQDEEADDGCFGAWRRVCGGSRRVQAGCGVERAHASGRSALRHAVGSEDVVPREVRRASLREGTDDAPAEGPCERARLVLAARGRRPREGRVQLLREPRQGARAARVGAGRERHQGGRVVRRGGRMGRHQHVDHGERQDEQEAARVRGSAPRMRGAACDRFDAWHDGGSRGGHACAAARRYGGRARHPHRLQREVPARADGRDDDRPAQERVLAAL